MKNIKTSFRFSNGHIDEIESFSDDALTTATLKGIKYAVAPTIVRNKLSGKVLIEILDEKLLVGFDVDKKEAINDLKQDVNAVYTFSELSI
jgi:hypothetical protein